MPGRSLVTLAVALLLVACGAGTTSARTLSASPASAGPHIFWSNWSGGDGTGLAIA